MDYKDISVETGTPDILGATADAGGVNFAIYSKHAARVDLCLFDDDGKTEVARISLPAKTGDVWHGYVPNLKAGQVYGYRVDGPYEPQNGHRFNPQKLLLDAYAKEIVGEINWMDAHSNPAKDNAADTVKARVTAPLHGFADAHDYYKRASSRFYLGGIRTPTLIIHSSDDPFIDAGSIPPPDELSASTELELHEHGGHVGFIGGTPGRPDYYLERRIPDWLLALHGSAG